ncbi:MAG: STAS domain-containing protein [Acidimicrobiales bacterium]|nr:STAS domain-containing protein [Actinomycetota bacterium]
MAGDSERQLPLGPRSSFTIGRARGTVVVTVHGEVELGDWSRLDKVLADIIDAQGNLDVVVDLSEVSSLERAAMPLIVEAARQAHSHGGRLRLADRACRDRSRPGPIQATWSDT